MTWLARKGMPGMARDEPPDGGRRMFRGIVRDGSGEVVHEPTMTPAGRSRPAEKDAPGAIAVASTR